MKENRRQMVEVSRESRADVSLTFGEKLSWTLGRVGGTILWGALSAFLLVFFTDIFGIPPAAAGTILLVARLMDGINDPLMGYIIDHLPRTRWGRFRPVLMVGAILASLNFVLLFAAPDLSQTGKLIWAYATYLLYGFLYDLVSIPTRALLPAMTQNTQERNGLSSISSIVGIGGVIVVNVITLPLVGMFADPQSGWRNTAFIYAVAAVVLIAIAVWRVRERIEPAKKEKYRLKDVRSVLLRNRPLIILLSTFIFSSLGTTIIQPGSLLYFTYNVGKPEMFGLTSLFTAVLMVIATAFFPSIARKLGRRKTYILFGMLGFVGNLALYFVPVDNIPLIFAVSGVLAVGMGPPGALNQAMIADTIEYAEFKSGVRSEGVIYASLSFGTKLVGGLAGAIPGYVLAATGYVPNVAQSQQALDGILFVKCVIPALCALISSILIGFYPLTEDKYATIVNELKARREATAGA